MSDHASREPEIEFDGPAVPVRVQIEPAAAGTGMRVEVDALRELE